MSNAVQASMGGVSNFHPYLGEHTANVYYSAWDQYAFVDTTDAGYSQLLLGTGDFCVEVFVYQYNAGAIFSFGTSIGAPSPQVPEMEYVTPQYYGEGLGGFIQRDAGFTVLTAAQYYDPGIYVTNANQQNWAHHCMIRSGTTMYLFVNGVLSANGPTTGVTGDLSGSQPFYMFGGPLGQYDASNNFAMSCYWRNFRYTLGSTVYDPTPGYIIPPNWWDTMSPVTGTVVLMGPGPGVTISGSNSYTNEATPTTAINLQNISPYGNYATIVTGNWPGPGGFDPQGWGAGTNTSQTYTAGGTPSTPKIVTTATSGAPTPILGTSCGDFTMTGTGVRITASGSPAWTTFGTNLSFAIDGWVWIPNNITAATRVIMAGDVTDSMGLMFGTGLGNTNGMDQIGIYRVGQTTPDYAGSVVFARNKWNYFCVQREVYNDGTNDRQNYYFWHAVEGQTFAQRVSTTTGTSDALSNAWAQPTNIFIGNSSASGTVSAGMYINMLRIFSSSHTTLDSITYPTRGVNVPYTIPAVDAQTTQLLVFQGTNGSTTFTNQTA